MNKEDIAQEITRSIYKDHQLMDDFKGYQCIKSYFLDLEMEDLLEMAVLYKCGPESL